MNPIIDISRTVLHSHRLILRAWKSSDADDFFAYASVPEIGAMAGWQPHIDVEESARIIDMFIRGRHTFAIEYEKRVIGSLEIEKYDEEDYPELTGMKGRMIGYTLSMDYWGRGLMPEAVDTVLDYLFDIEDLDFVIAGHFDWNTRSGKVLEKCGFHPLRNSEFICSSGKVEKTVEYIIYREDHT